MAIRRDRNLRSLSPEAGKIFQVDSDERQRSIWKGHSMISIVHHASNAQSLTVTHANSHRWLGNRISNWIDKRLFSWKRLPLSCHRIHANISERQQQRSERFSKNAFDITPIETLGSYSQSESHLWRECWCTKIISSSRILIAHVVYQL